MVGVLALAACSSEPSDPIAAFCERTNVYETHQDGLADALFRPDDLEAHIAESIDQLDGLVEIAPPTVAADVTAVRNGFNELEATLAASNYSILDVDEAALDAASTAEASDRLDRFLLANCREEGDPFVSPEDPNAPRPFSQTELRDLVADGEADEDADLADSIARQLSEELGLGNEDARCVVGEMSLSTLSALAGGQAVTEADSAAFAAALESCGAEIGG